MKKIVLCILLSFTFLSFVFCDEIQNLNESIYTQASTQISNDSVNTKNNINSDFIYQLIANGVTIIVAFIAGYLPSYLNKKNDSLKSKADRLEAFYVDVSEWFNSAFLQLSVFNMVFNGKMTTSQYDEWLNKNSTKKNQLSSEISLYLYFPNIEKEYKDMTNSVQEAFTYILWLESKTNYSTQDRKKYDELVLSTNKKFEILKSKIIEETRHCK